jgi:hypothetical protein
MPYSFYYGGEAFGVRQLAAAFAALTNTGILAKAADLGAFAKPSCRTPIGRAFCKTMRH